MHTARGESDPRYETLILTAEDDTTARVIDRILQETRMHYFMFSRALRMGGMMGHGRGMGPGRGRGGPACAVGECIATRLAASAAYNFLEFERTPHKQGRGISCGNAIECGQSQDSHPRRGFMEFWIGLSIGMHLGKVIDEYLEK